MTTSSNTKNEQKPYYWLSVFLLFVISFITGLFGFRHYFILNNIDHDFWKSLYCTIQLYVLKSGDVTGIIPFELQLARFIAPLGPAIAIILTMIEIFREQWNNWVISRMKNHVVIIGFGAKGRNIMEEYLSKGKMVLVIEQDPSNPNLGFITSPRCRKLVVNAANISKLKKGNIAKADYCFLLLGDDSLQVKVCMEIYQIITDSGRDIYHPFNCVMHLNRHEFLSTMKENKLVRDTKDAFNLTIFNLYENSARCLFMECPPDRSGLLPASESFVQMIIFGFELAGEALALQTALTGHYANRKKSHVLIFDRLAEVKVPDFLKRYPAFTDYCVLEYDNTEADSPQLINHLVKYIRKPDAITTLVLCFDNKTQNLLLGLQLESVCREGLKEPINIFVRTKDESDFAFAPSSVRPYGLPIKVCSHDVIFGETLDTMAKAIHKEYFERRKKAKNFGEKPADVDWENLQLEYKDSNRKAADHIGVKIRAINCSIVDIKDRREPAIFSKEEIEMLAELEHERWQAERSLAGWSYGASDNKKTRTTPFLLEWTNENLSDSVKDYDRGSVINIPIVLNLVGLKVVRKKN